MVLILEFQMKKFLILLFLTTFTLILVSCSDDEDGGEGGDRGEGQACESSFDCPIGYTCDAEKRLARTDQKTTTVPVILTAAETETETETAATQIIPANRTATTIR